MVSGSFTNSVVVYIILAKNNTYYTGITNDINRREKEHRKGRSKYLGRVGVNKLIWVSSGFSRREAARLERHIKSTGALKFMIKNNIKWHH